MKADTKGTSLTYHLAEALTSYTYSAGSSLERRTDVLAIIHGIVVAMIGYQDKNAELLSNIETNIQALNHTYEPCIENSPEAADKRRAYKELQRLTYNALLKPIRSENLVSNAVMKQLKGDWDRKEGM